MTLANQHSKILDIELSCDACCVGVWLLLYDQAFLGNDCLVAYDSVKVTLTFTYAKIER